MWSSRKLCGTRLLMQLRGSLGAGAGAGVAAVGRSASDESKTRAQPCWTGRLWSSSPLAPPSSNLADV
eukprot:scaffold46823_cov60-Phaeocystis_antarctica.AAC.2